jgi:hypothetical protein
LIYAGIQDVLPRVIALDERPTGQAVLLGFVASPVRDLDVVPDVSMSRVRLVAQRNDVIDAWRQRIGMVTLPGLNWFTAQATRPFIAVSNSRDADRVDAWKILFPCSCGVLLRSLWLQRLPPRSPALLRTESIWPGAERIWNVAAALPAFVCPVALQQFLAIVSQFPQDADPPSPFFCKQHTTELGQLP